MTRTIASVAREFGYTPERYLYYERRSYDASIVTGESYCGSKLYFVTPLNVPGFKAHMDALVPRTMHDEWERFSTTSPWPTTDIPDLTLDGVRGEEAKRTEFEGGSRRIEVRRYERGSVDDVLGVSVQLENTTVLRGALAVNGRPIHENVIEIRGNTGPYPIWVPCRWTDSYKPLPPFAP